MSKAGLGWLLTIPPNDITHSEFRILSLLSLLHREDQQYLSISITTIQKKTTVSRQGVVNALNAFVKKGWLRRVQGNKKTASQYELLFPKSGDVVKSVDHPSQMSVLGWSTECTRPSQMSVPLYIEDNSLYNNDQNDLNLENLWERFWGLYPRKIAQAQAKEVFAKTLKYVSADILHDRLKRQVALWNKNKTEVNFIPYAATWLTKKLWDDDILKPKNVVNEKIDDVNDISRRVTDERAEEILKSLPIHLRR